MKKIILISFTLLFSLLFLFGCDKSNGTGSQSNKQFSESTSLNNTASKSGSSSASSSNSNSLSNNPNSASKNSSSTSLVNSSSNSGSSNAPTPEAPISRTTSYVDRMNAYIDSGYVNDNTFINYIKNLGAFNANAPEVANAIYASPNGNGDGTKNSPYSLQDALDEVTAGKTLYLKGGTYNANSMDGYYLEKGGNASNYITIRNYPNETPIITNSYVGQEAYGIQLSASCKYIIFEGIEISNITSKCAYGIAMYGDGQNHIILRNNHIHHIVTNSSNPETDENAGANAIIVNGETNNAVSQMLIANNYCHDNITGWCETISITGNTEYIYVIENRVQNNSNIGIDFYGNAGYGPSPQYDQPRFCIAAGNYITHSICGYADCAGLYVDGARDILLHYNIVSDSHYGLEIGSEERQDEYPVRNITARNNLFYNNLLVGIRVGGYESTDPEYNTGIVKNTKIYNNTLVNNNKETDAEKGEPMQILLAKVDGVDIRNNIIYSTTDTVIYGCESTQANCKNLTFKKNLIYIDGKTDSTLQFEMFTSSQEGLSSFNSLISGTDIFGEVTLSSDYALVSGAAVDAADGTVEVGNYDILLNPRKAGGLDIGAFEKQS